MIQRVRWNRAALPPPPLSLLSADTPTLRQFPRLLLLDRALPRAVPILVADRSIVRGLVKEARRLGALAADRELVWWNSSVTYTADEMYYAGELNRRSENEPWGSGVNKTNPNACAWALSMPRGCRRLAAEEPPGGFSSCTARTPSPGG